MYDFSSIGNWSKVSMLLFWKVIIFKAGSIIFIVWKIFRGTLAISMILFPFFGLICKVTGNRDSVVDNNCCRLDFNCSLS